MTKTTSSEQQARPHVPLSCDVPSSAVWCGVTALFVVCLFVADRRQMTFLNCLLMASSTAGAAAVCLLTARRFLARLPYGLIAAPVLLPAFWTAYACILPVAYLYGGSSYSPLMESFYVKTQLCVLIGSAAMCLGLTLFPKKLESLCPQELSEVSRCALRNVWVMAVGLSMIVLVDVVSKGAFDRGTRLATPMGKLVWIVSQLSPLAAYVVLGLPIFLFGGERKRSRFWNIYLIAALPLIALVVLRLQLRLMAVVVFLFLAARCAHQGRLRARSWIAVVAAFLFMFPIMRIVRVGHVIEGGRGLHSAVDLVMYGATQGVKGAYGEASVVKTDEWERAGHTFELTAATVRAIPESRPYFSGSLLIEDLRFLVPYMFYPEKYDKPLHQPETLINMRARGDASDTGIGPVVYLWAEGGVLLVVGGMFLFGLAYGWVYFACVSRLEKGWPVIFYSLFILSMMNLEEDWIQNLLQPARLCVVWGALWCVARLGAVAGLGEKRRQERRLASAQE